MKGKLKKWLKENGKNSLGTVLDKIGENTSIPIASGIIESIGESLMDDPELTSEQKAEAAEAVKQEIEFYKAKQKELTERHKNDMLSDSWLSKNIRPLTLLTLLTVHVVSFVLHWSGVDTPVRYLSMNEHLLLFCFEFYFVARGVEKLLSGKLPNLFKRK